LKTSFAISSRSSSQTAGAFSALIKIATMMRSKIRRRA
jgi:hypothetical protein